FALIKCLKADRYGNLIYNKTARNFAPIMAMAAENTIVQTKEFVAVGDIDPEVVVTPGIFVDQVVTISNPLLESVLVSAGEVYP
ncbi:MAG: 3-oxoadipate CoA-transferase, partial [Kordiimonadaceae bacterium]|nr:3-oxoadipate CoA-transferase [Kordiimonadaceae bacterium]